MDLNGLKFIRAKVECSTFVLIKYKNTQLKCRIVQSTQSMLEMYVL